MESLGCPTPAPGDDWISGGFSLDRGVRADAVCNGRPQGAPLRIRAFKSGTAPGPSPSPRPRIGRESLQNLARR
jgi:hypothetical protein